MAPGEVILFMKLPVDASGNPRGHGSLNDVFLPTHQDYQNNLWVHLVRERHKPSNARALIGTRAGLPGRLFVIRNVTAPRRSMKHGGQHAFTNVPDLGVDLKRAFDPRLKIFLGFGGSRILEVIKCAAISDRGCQRAELQWSHLDTFTEARHPGNSSSLRRLVWHFARLFLGDFITGKLPKSEHSGVARYNVKSHAS